VLPVPQAEASRQPAAASAYWSSGAAVRLASALWLFKRGRTVFCFRLLYCRKPIGEAPVVAAGGSADRQVHSSSESAKCGGALLSIV
jgi:hypothetical protein